LGSQTSAGFFVALPQVRCDAGCPVIQSRKRKTRNGL